LPARTRAAAGLCLREGTGRRKACGDRPGGAGAVTIIEAIEDRNVFGPAFRDPETWRAWKVFLKALFGLRMEPGELELFRAATGRAEAPGSPAKEAFAIVGRCGGKSKISAGVVVALACFKDWRPYLSARERG